MSKLNNNLKNWFFDYAKNSASDKYTELKKVTIVIPTYERQDFILRQLLYWHGSGVQLLILDGSDASLPESVLNVLNNWGDVRYLHLPMSIETRLQHAISYICTPYTAILSDDEFFLKGTLNRLVTKLDEDAELSGCIGQSVSFDFDKDTEEVIYAPGYKHSGFKATQDDVSERLAYAMNPYNAATCYGLLRTEVWQSGWGGIEAFTSPNVPEIYQSITTYVHGKYFAVDELYWLRSSENAPITTSDWDRGFSFNQWWMDESYRSEKELFLSKLEDTVVSQKNVNRKNAKAIIVDAVDVYLVFCEQYFKVSFLTVLRNNLVKGLKFFLPSILFKTLKNVFTSNKTIAKPLNKNVKYPWLAFTTSNNVDENQSDMKEIVSLIKSFHNARERVYKK